jgi:hypothetical protein
LTLPINLTGCVLLSWAVGGTSPSFTQVYATLLTRSTTVLSAPQSSGGAEIAATIKAGSTAAQTSDTALVVALSPNNPLPAASSPSMEQIFGTVSGVIKGSAGSLMSFYGANYSNLSVNYLQFFNSTSAPGVGAIPFMEFEVGVSGNLKSYMLDRDFFSDAGVSFSTGIAYGWSSTSGSYTAITITTNTLTVTYE